MKPQQVQFLTKILGRDGSEAILKAVDRYGALESVLLPRSILSWINNVAPFGHEGEIPGVPDSHIQFHKAEDGFVGSVNIYDFVYDFEKASVFHLASSLALALDVEPNLITIKDLDIERLGKSIDMLVKAAIVKEVKEELAKVKATEQPAGGASPIQPIQAVAPAPTAPATPKTTEAPKMAKPKVKLPIPSKIKITKSEMSHKCDLCGKGSFLESTYVGCSCLMDLAKSVQTVNDELVLGEDWDRDAILVLLECIGRVESGR